MCPSTPGCDGSGQWLAGLLEERDTETTLQSRLEALFAPDPRYGVSVDEEMVNKYVIGAALRR